MTALPDDYIALLEVVACAFSLYEADTGATPVLVGEAATAIATAGAFMSGDLDIVASDDQAFDRSMASCGFRADDRVGHLLCGYYHPDHAAYGIELVSGMLFDGLSDPGKLLRITLRQGSLVLPSLEDLIADRLGQHAIASPSDDSRLRQARLIFAMANSLDLAYLISRIEQDGGDPHLLDLDAAQSGGRPE